MAFLTKAANRGSIATGYDIENSVKLEQDNSEYLKSTSAYAYTTPTSLTTGTFSCWVKRTEIGAGGYQAYVFVSGNSARYAVLYFENDLIKIYSGDSSFNGTYPSTNAVFRDTSAWYHIVLRFDSTDSTAANRLRLYVNGEEQTWSTAPNITQNGHITFAAIGGPTWHAWGQNYGYFSPTHFFSGYLAEAQYIDGQALAPTEFGETDSNSGIWKPKEYDGTYGNAGYYLDFEDSSNLGNDVSGNGFDFDLTNITSADQATDTPTNNFCTFNPLMDQGNSPTISEGAMKSTGGGGNWNQTWGSIGVKSGKWYYEMKVTNTSSTGYFGASTTPAVSDYTNTVQLMYNTSFMVGTASGIDYYYWQNGSQTSNEATGWGNLVNNDVLGLALDLDASTKKFYLYKNGSLLNSGGTNLPTNMQDEFIFPLYVQYENRQDEINFGGYTISSISSAASDANGYGTFEYAPPSGYYALCTKNLAQYGG